MCFRRRQLNGVVAGNADRSNHPRLTMPVSSFAGPSSLANSRTRLGSTTIHDTAPVRHNPAATRNEAVHPKWLAIAGVSEAVTAPPICAPIFIKPETDPEELPAMSAVTDQKELCERYNAPAPPANTTLANRALWTSAPNTRNAPAVAMAAAARYQRPIRGPYMRVNRSLSVPPNGQQAAMARNGSIA